VKITRDPVGVVSGLGRGAVAGGCRRLPQRWARRSGALARFNEAVSERPAPLVSARMRLGHRLRLDLRSRTEWFAYYTGRYDDSRIQTAQRLLRRSGAVAVDAGATIGFWTVPPAKAVAARAGTVIAVEPLSANRGRLEENVHLNRLSDAIHVVAAALSDTSHTAELTLREDFQAGAQTGDAAIEIADGTDEPFPTVRVATRRVDDIVRQLGIQRVDLIKADVEGHDDRLLTGARDVLARDRPVIFAELNCIYYQRRGIDTVDAFAERMAPLGYVSIRPVAGGWMIDEDFASPKPVDDLVLVGRKRAASVTAALRRAELNGGP
jgi:FkbM family methyltransferase